MMRFGEYSIHLSYVLVIRFCVTTEGFSPRIEGGKLPCDKWFPSCCILAHFRISSSPQPTKNYTLAFSKSQPQIDPSPRTRRWKPSRGLRTEILEIQ